MNTIPTKSAVHPLTLRARQRVAHLWTVDGMSESDIVKTLADEGLRRPDGRHWTAHAVGKLVAAIKWANAEDMSKLPSVQATSDSDRGVYFAKSELGQDGAIATAVNKTHAALVEEVERLRRELEAAQRPAPDKPWATDHGPLHSFAGVVGRQWSRPTPVPADAGNRDDDSDDSRPSVGAPAPHAGGTIGDPATISLPRG